MAETNYDILGITDSASNKEIRDAYRKLALQHHSDRGGDESAFKKIKQAYEDLKIGKKYPDTDDEKKDRSKFYSGDDEAEKRKKNLILAKDISKEVKTAEDWAGALNRSNVTGMRLFGSRELGQMEFERKANHVLLIKGKFWAGNLTYDGPIRMMGSITNPYFAKDERLKTKIQVTKGNFVLVNPIDNKYDVDSGATIIADDGDIMVGSVSGIKETLPDPHGKVGLFITNEHFTTLKAPKGKIVAGNVRETAILEANEIIVLNLVDNIKIKAKTIHVYGSKVNYDVEIQLMQGGKIRFHDNGSGFDISDDAIIKLENNKKFRLHDLKTSKMISYGGKDITYDYLDNLGQKTESTSGGWMSKLKRKNTN